MPRPKDSRPPSERLGPIPDYDPATLPTPRVGRPRGTPGMITRSVDYSCEDCGRATDRDELLVKRCVWLRLGRKGKQIKSRAVKWVCNDCAAVDPDWNRRPHADSPGLRGTRIAES